MKPIARIRTDFNEKFGIPRQSGRVPQLVGRVVFEPEYRHPDALRGIDGFSHLWLIFDFSEAHRDTWSATVRPPRLGGNERIGVFATRSPFRPNPIGLSCVRFLGVEHTETEGDVLLVGGADLLDNTPIYDIKPYLPYADCHPEAVGGFADSAVVRHLQVNVPESLLACIPENKRDALIACLAEDPRPSYQDDPTRIYHMRFADRDVHFTVSDSTATVVRIDV
ncbi:MAG: tRNA (N6-threonylcarbamoyladenosine(37)-N6)-methyltransferase TrmO [Clostridia bacterium]|nr:tRNA (N6-threonylcarbamoyladenosine(37)-N6)-methyltransferase TrmO [Clostridia bacterium]